MSMREIKFRVWNGREMLPPLTLRGIASELSYLPEQHLDDCMFEQWCGLRDHTGRDIYEGDIVAVHSDRHKRRLISYADDDDTSGEGWKDNAGRIPIYEQTDEPPTGPVSDVHVYPWGVVTWQDDRARFYLCLHQANERGVISIDLDEHGYTFEVVGNVHEHKHLLATPQS